MDNLNVGGMILMEKYIGLYLLIVVAIFIGNCISAVRIMSGHMKRLKQAEENGWFVMAKRVKAKHVIRQTSSTKEFYGEEVGSDYSKTLVTEYEYFVNNKRYTFIINGDSRIEEIQHFYDPKYPGWIGDGGKPRVGLRLILTEVIGYIIFYLICKW